MAAGSRFSIEAVISMVDRISGPMRRAGNSAKGFSAKMQTQFLGVNRTVDSINRKINRVGGRAARVGMAALGVGAGLVTRQFIQFDDAIFAASAKFKGLDITTKAGMATMEQLRKTARKVGEETRFNAVQAAQGLDFLALAGFDATQAMAALPQVTKLATVANIDLATATDIASDSLGAFNLMTEDSTQLQKNLTRVNDVFAKTTATSNTNLEMLFESVKKGAPTFTSAGQSIESFSALVGVMANAGVKGSESGTQLRNMMLRLAAPTGQAANLLNQLGVQVKDSQGNFRDVIDILADFESGTKNMGTAQKTATLSTIFGARSVTGMNLLLAQGSDKLKEYRDTLLKSGGAAKKMAAVIEQSAGNKLRALGSAATELGFKILDAFAGEGKKGIDTLTKGVREFDVKPIVSTLKVLFAIISTVFTILQPFLPLIFAIIIAIKAWTLVQSILNIVMLANPIGLIILAITALVAAIVGVVMHWEQLKQSMLDTTLGQGLLMVINAISEALDNITAKIKGVTQLFAGDIGGFLKTMATTTDVGGEAARELLAKGAGGFASPRSSEIITERTNTTKGTLDINVAAQKGTTATTGGKLPPTMSLNTGVEE